MATDPRPARRPSWSWGEVALAAVVVAVVLLMIAPVATPVLDLLFAAGLGLAVVMVMAALLVRTPTSMATFPALVLISTLVRLGLVVAVSRGVLGDADGGEVVAGFGAHVAGGNLLVGLVVFAVIAIFQFVVVARGAERVAEVAARFALDAMPGKQMAIDADLRAGAVDAAEAGRRRAALEREAHFYGAMDGAMKFVKGDAIASLLVVIVVGVAGLAIGVGWRDQSLADAADTYAVLAVGAGLVVQLPGLLVALAAALLVTRVASESEAALGDELGTQLFGQPRAVAAAAVLLCGLALIPGLPAPPFLGLAAVCAAIAIALGVRAARAPGQAAQVATAPVRVDAAPPASLALGPGLSSTPELATRLDAVRQRLFDDLGVRVPPLTVLNTGEQGTVGLGDREVALALDGVTVDFAEAPAGAANDAIAEAARRALLRVAHELVTLDAVQARLDELVATHPATVREVVPRIAPLPVVTAVVRALVREGVSVRDLAAVLDGIAAQPAPAGGFGPADAAALAEKVRGALRRHITAAHAPRGQLAAFTVDAMIEDALRGAVITRDGAAVLALEPELARDIVAAARSALPAGERSVVLASGDVRRHLRALLEPELPDVAVLAPHELAAGVTVRAAGRIAV
jgi:type III secretion protein V